MSKREFTPEQLSAIETRDKTLLVSAAAGSGKTATLTERIIRSITDKKNPESISNMLIVTFTNAAVKELKERISSALRLALAENKNDPRLEKELHMLPAARICTIDSFCNELLRNNTEKYGISPTYRIADTIEANILSKSVLSALIEAAYDGELSDEVASAEDFEELTSLFVGVKSDSKLEEEFLLLYKKTEHIERGVSIFSDFAETYAEEAALPVESNRFGKFLFEHLHLGVNHYMKLYSSVMEELDRCDKTEAKYFDAMKADKAFLSFLSRCSSYKEVYSALLSYNHADNPSVRGEKSPTVLRAAALRKELLEYLRTKIKNKYFIYTEEEWQANLSELSRVLDILGKFLKKFDTVYMAEKKRRSMLEYSDIERLAFLSLYEGGEPSDLAIALRNQFTSVYIDEYQDVNELQNRIFEAISKDSNRFMVGDIKQSIYGFRGAQPAIFAKMKEAFPSLGRDESSSYASVFMSKNFRCDESIVNFVNGIFDVMFNVARESIGYVYEDRLEFAKTQEASEYRRPKICLFDKTVLEDGDESEEELKLSELSPKWVAKEIKDILATEKKNDGSPITPKDIAILLRKDSGRCKAYKDALLALGISARIPEDKDFFFNAEIQLTICLLNTIDNPRRDIYLAGLMRSPLYDFTPDELFIIRKLGGDGSLWEALVSYTEGNESFVKGRSFIDAINKYRAIAEGMPADMLLQRLYSETGLLALASANGCRDNLMILYDYARKFESSSFKGLYNFINYVNTAINSGAKFSVAETSEEDSESVTVTTMHKSKGLEYPVVILGDAGTSLLSPLEKKAKVAFSETLGAAIKLRMEGTLALVESPVFNAILDYNDKAALEEELRVYYVALTRARERLIIAGALSGGTLEEALAKGKERRSFIGSYSLNQMKTFTDILTFAASEGEYLSPEEEYKKISDLISDDSKKEEKEEEKTNDTEDGLYGALAERLGFKYPHYHLTTLPEKLSVSKLYPTVLDGAEGDVEMTIDRSSLPDNDERETLPRFMGGDAADESAKRGIATHLVLQFCDLDSLKTLGAEGELARLISHGFISKEDGERVRLNELKQFLASELYSEMKNAKSLYREFRFNAMLDASNFTSDEKKKEDLTGRKILAQGVIDCLIEDTDGNLHLVDYKTDRLTKRELADKSIARDTLSKKHSLQLSYYALAVEKIFGKRPVSVRVYSLPLGDTVDV